MKSAGVCGVLGVVVASFIQSSGAPVSPPSARVRSIGGIDTVAIVGVGVVAVRGTMVGRRGDTLLMATPLEVSGNFSASDGVKFMSKNRRTILVQVRAASRTVGAGKGVATTVSFVRGEWIIAMQR